MWCLCAGIHSRKEGAEKHLIHCFRVYSLCIRFFEAEKYILR